MHKRTSVNLRPPLAAWPGKTNVETATSWSSLAQLLTGNEVRRIEKGRKLSKLCPKLENGFVLFREFWWRNRSPDLVPFEASVPVCCLPRERVSEPGCPGGGEVVPLWPKAIPKRRE